MKKISIWAAKNPKKAIPIIVISICILIFNASAIGIMLFDQGIEINHNALYLLTGLFSISILIYPLKREKLNFLRSNKIYIRQKTADGIIVFCIFIGSMVLSNQYQNPKSYNSFSFVKNVSATDIKSNKKSGCQNSNLRNSANSKDKITYASVHSNEKKNIKTYLFFKKNTNKKGLKPFNGPGYGGIIFASILLGLILLIVVCALACTSHIAAAVLTLLGAGSLFVILIAQAVRQKRESLEQTSSI